ncbi:integrase [Streptomyces rubiginosohelvolus]|uniref:integrase n=1 Tax=Streptomyces rubiginosohelvolus TaxID=67362 RepID=UPI0033B474E9
MTAAPRHAVDAAAPAAADTIAVGDTVRFRGADWVVTAFHGPRLFLDVAEPMEPEEPAEPLIILQTAVTSAPDFAVLNRAAPRSTLPGRIGEFHALPRDVRKAAEKWERHVKEVLHQQAPNVPATTPPNPAFDPKRRTLRQRYQAKADQLTQAGVPVSAATVERKCAAWRKEGLMGLVDKRHLRTANPHGRVDGRVVDIVWEILDDERARGLSPGTLSRLIDRVEQTVRVRYAKLLADPKTARGLVNSPATFYRLLERLGITAENAHTAAARQAAGSAISAARSGSRRATWARWPGELVQIDTTGLDVLVLGDDGRVISVELTIAIDVATRSIVGSLIVPKRTGRTGGTGRWLAGRATRSFDTMQVVAQTTAPLPARPGWAPETFMEGSDLPFEDLLAADPRFAGSAARPVIKPETLVIDHGSPFISADFTRACHSLGIEVREARLRTAPDKAIVERAMRAVKTGFSQYLATYTHHRLDLRGKRVRKQPLWTIPQLQELFEQWVVLHWQQTPHGALRSPFTPGLRLTPNQMYAALVSLRGYRSTTLAEQENRKLLPAVWVRVSRKGFQINNRTYNLGRGKLDPCRGSSGITAQQGRWEVHYSPDHPEVAWLFNHRAEPGTDPWIEVPFIHRRLLSDRWTEETWAEALHIHLAAGGSRRDEAAITRATARLLRTATAGPQATTPTSKPTPRPAAPSRPALPAPAEPYDDLPPLDPESVRPFRSLDRPAGDLFDASEPARGAGQSLDEFLASLPGLHPPTSTDPRPMSETDGRPRPEKTLRADNSPASPPPGGLPSDEPDSARQGDDQ